MSAAGLSTHVLDVTHGRPAAGVSVRLEFKAAEGWREAGSGVTNEDGRIASLSPDQLTAGSYRIEVDVGAYFQRCATEFFFSTVSLTFTIKGPAQHCHVPLLISPFAVTSYKGS